MFPLTKRIRKNEYVKNTGLSLSLKKGKIYSKYRLYDGEEEQVGMMQGCKNITTSSKG